MRVLHDVPIVTERLTTMRPPSGTHVLHPSLRDEFEQVKMTLEPLTLEDITKVWTALSLRYRLSAAYVVNVVQIESRRPPRIPRPVGQPVSPTSRRCRATPPTPGPMVYVLTIQTPTITEVSVRARPASSSRFPTRRSATLSSCAARPSPGPSRACGSARSSSRRRSPMGDRVVAIDS